MLTLTTFQAEVSGNVATAGYLLGALSILVVATVLFFAIRLFRTKKSNLHQGPTK